VLEESTATPAVVAPVANVSGVHEAMAHVEIKPDS